MMAHGLLKTLPHPVGDHLGGDRYDLPGKAIPWLRKCYALTVVIRTLVKPANVPTWESFATNILL